MPRIGPALLSPLLVLAALRAQSDNGLVVRPDPRNAVAQALVGTWRLDGTLGKRLGGAGRIDRIEFRTDADVVGKVPAAIAAKLRELPLYQQGTMLMDGTVHPYLLTVIHGNPMIVWFRERDGDPMGDTESFLVAIARAKESSGDVLLLGGDTAETPMAAYGREPAGTPRLEPEAVITHMAQLLEAGKGREFVETYMSPADMAKMKERGRTLDDLAKRFEGERVKELIAMLQAISKVPPQWNEARDEASWDVDQKPGKLRLQLVDGRWYVKDR